VKFTLSKAAERDLTAILNYGTQAHGWSTAEAYARHLQEAMQCLTDYPELGAVRSELAAGLRSLPCGEHLIFYRSAPETIHIVRILHKAMDARRWLAP
jgi:toxin ParE1/3/4